jgi:F0F1-type ATP synthase membrane subunit b/b'
MLSVTEKTSEYQKSLRQARSEAYAFSETQRAEAMKERQERLNEMRAQLAESVAKEKQAIGQQAADARTTLASESRQIAAEIGSRILNRPIG